MSPAASSESSPHYTDLGQSDHPHGPPRKKMRKGTKSCLECRRRKIKCTFEPGRSSACNECHARGSTCIDQEHGDLQSYSQSAALADQSSYSLRERVAQLEGLVKQVLYKLPEDENASASTGGKGGSSHVDAQAAEVLKSLRNNASATANAIEQSIHLPAGLRDAAPALTLFDNAVIRREESPPEVSRSQYNKSKALVAALHQLLPSPRDLDIILDESAKWWVTWKEMFPEIADRRCDSIKDSVSSSLRSDNPAEIAKMMLCIAISVHQMPPDFDWARLQLRDNPVELMEKYISAIGQLITSDDDIAATVDGIVCMVLEAKYNINLGRPRRAWLLSHRAIAFAQLLGLHRLSSRKPENPDPEYQRQVTLWCHLFTGDRYLSLLLGLPYAVSEAFCVPYIPPVGVTMPGVSEGEMYVARMVPLLTKIIDRNQSPIPVPFSASLRLDQDLEELHDRQAPSWWSPERVPGSTVPEHFSRIQAAFFHHQTRVLIHLPFMLKSSSDKRYQFSHQAALESSREMIKYYLALRQETDVGPYMCKVIDFAAFTAAMLLLLNLCGYSQHSRGALVQQPDLDQDQLDSELIDTVIANLHEAAKESGGVVAAQSAKTLEMLAKVRHGCDDESGRDQCDQEKCQVSIPYFGTITLGLGNHFVPIKPGTYRERGQTSRKQSTAAMMPSVTGLPTPPSMSSNSTHQSPMSTTLDSMRSTVAYPLQASSSGPTAEFIAPGFHPPQQQQTYVNNEDPFINFDSYMAFPTMDFPTANSGGSGSSSSRSGSIGFGTPQSFPSAGGQFDPNNFSAGFPFGVGGNTDLDNGWNWFPIDGGSVI